MLTQIEGDEHVSTEISGDRVTDFVADMASALARAPPGGIRLVWELHVLIPGGLNG